MLLRSRALSSLSPDELSRLQPLLEPVPLVTERVFTETGYDGVPVETQSRDVFTFRSGEIAVENSYPEQRSS